MIGQTGSLGHDLCRLQLACMKSMTVFQNPTYRRQWPEGRDSDEAGLSSWVAPGQSQVIGSGCRSLGLWSREWRVVIEPS